MAKVVIYLGKFWRGSIFREFHKLAATSCSFKSTAGIQHGSTMDFSDIEVDADDFHLGGEHPVNTQ